MAIEDFFPNFCSYFDDFSHPEDYLDMSNEELFAASSGARSEKLKSIRKYYKLHNHLSEKQRYCLATWISEKDNKYV